MDASHNWVDVNAPFHERHRDLRIGNWVVQPRTIGLAAIGLVTAAVIIHGFGMKASKRLDGAVLFEARREWDAKHPDNAIGYYDADRTIIHKDGTKEEISAEAFEELLQTDYENALKKIGAAAASAVAAGTDAAKDATDSLADKASTAVEEVEAEAKATEDEAVEAVEEAEAEAIETTEEAEDTVEEETDESKGGQE